MKPRPIDKTKKSNRRCVNCVHFKNDVRNHYRYWHGDRSYHCLHTDQPIDYWNCCKEFQWNPDKTYKTEE